MTIKPTLIVTSTERLIPPLEGANRKIHDVLLALQTLYHLVVITYQKNGCVLQDLQDYWASGDTEFYILSLNSGLTSAKATVTGTLRTVQIRRFHQERQIVNGLINKGTQARLLIDGLSGAPLVRHYISGVVISCNDCASKMFRDEQRLNPNPLKKALAFWRCRGSRHMEKYYLHFADVVHVVKVEDGDCLKQINPLIKPIVIPLASIGTVPVLMSPSCSTQIQPRVLIWGNLSLGNISSGYMALLPALEKAQICQMTRISVLGRIPHEEFVKKFGALGRCLDYVERTDDLDAFLGQFDLVIIPDLGGSGQKFRCLDALRLGKCVVGFDIPFAGLPKHPRAYFVRCHDPQDLVYQLKRFLASGEWREIGQEGQRVFIQHLGFESFQRKWCALIDSTPPLQIRGSSC